MQVNEIAARVHTTAQSKGFWRDRDEKFYVATKLGLITTEVAEAIEADRKKLKDKDLPQYDGVAVELADVVIRALDLMTGLGYNPEEVIQAKADFNDGREHMHGGKAY